MVCLKSSGILVESPKKLIAPALGNHFESDYQVRY